MCILSQKTVRGTYCVIMSQMDLFWTQYLILYKLLIGN